MKVESLVGQDGILRRVGNPPAGRCAQAAKPIDNRPKVANLPHDAGDPKIVAAREESNG